MKLPDAKESILKLLHEEGRAPMTGAEIASSLKLHGGMAKKLQKLLNQLVLEGEIVCVRQNRYSIGDPLDLVSGHLDLMRSGNGIVTDARDAREVFVDADDINTALPGDTVVARLYPDSTPDEKGRVEGKIIKIVERSRHDIVGTLKSTGKFLFVVPMDPSYKRDFYVGDAKGAKVGDRTVIRFVSWENKQLNPEAEIVEVIGPADKPTLDTLAIIRQYGFNEAFPEEVVRKAESVSSLVSTPGPRMDLRNRFVMTIDPEKARDYDDALSLEIGADGRRVLGVHIADVSHFVARDSVLDREARRRGNSVYLPDKVIPMLPEQLSNGVCSLRPNEDRLVFSVFITFDREGNVVAKSFAKGIICSKLRLTYEQAMSVIAAQSGQKIARAESWRSGSNTRQMSPQRSDKGQGGGFVMPQQGRDLILSIHALAKQVRAKRFAQYALDLDMPDTEVIIGKDGMIDEIRLVPNDPSHQLIEECMVAANEAVVTELANRRLTAITRAHEPPREDKIEELVVQLIGMGFKPMDLYNRKSLAEFLKKNADHPLVYSVRVAVLRSMNRAVYSAGFEGHYALAKKYYGHFTSPIRRYPDLILHRQLSQVLFGGIGAAAKCATQTAAGSVGKAVAERRGDDGATTSAKSDALFYQKKDIAAIASECTQTEWMADQAERGLIEIKKYRLLEQQLSRRKPVVYDAVVASCVNFGMFVEILALQVQGLVHVSEMSNQFVRFDKSTSTLRAGKDIFKSGRKLKVIISRVDMEKRRLDFRLA